MKFRSTAMRRLAVIGCWVALALVPTGCTERSREATPGERSLPGDGIADTLAEGGIPQGVTRMPPEGPSGPSQLLRTVHRQADLAAFMEAFHLAVQGRDREQVLRLMTPRFQLDGSTAAEDTRFGVIASLDEHRGWAKLDSLLALGYRETDGEAVVFPRTWNGRPEEPHGRLVATPPSGWIWESYRRPPERGLQ